MESFILGKCSCNCGKDIKLRTVRGYLARFVNGHSRLKVIYNCSRCRDQRWFIQCKCGKCDEVITLRDKFYEIREFAFGHQIRVRNQYKERNPMWNNGRSFNKILGYWTNRVPDHPYQNNGRVRTHRLIYEHYLSIIFDEEIFLPPKFDIHHINGQKDDNSLINLELLTHSQHTVLHQTIDMSSRKCANPLCADPEGYPARRWFNDGFGGHYCNRCYMKINRYKYSKKYKKM